jgi:FkbM family methyltransferase
MSQFLTQISCYSDRYRLNRLDRVKLLIHYPLFKLAYLADSRDDVISRVASAALRPVRGYSVRHVIAGVGGRLAVAVPVDPSGFASFSEIFFRDEYDVACDQISIDTLVDLGGNVGMASLFLMSNFSIRRALIVEANPVLREAIRRQLMSVDATVTIENAAVVGRTSPDGVDFAVAANHRLSSVGGSSGNCVTVPAYGLSDLLDRHGIGSADLLKMDIEGSEFDVLREDHEGLLRFRQILVEVHGEPDTRQQFLAGLTQLGFEVTVRTETVRALVAFASRA